MANAITYTQDIIDSRDVTARIEELESELIEAKDGENEASEQLDLEEWLKNAASKDGHPLQEAAEELLILKAFANDGECLADWEHGETLIRGSYFEDYARKLAEDCGMINKGASWPNNCIDWERAAHELQQDYTSLDFEGVTYWAR